MDECITIPPSFIYRGAQFTGHGNLVKTDGHAPVEKVEYFVMEELRKNSDLCEGKYKYIVVENKKMLYAIFCIFLSLKETDPLSLCWGTLSIQDKYKGEKK